MTNAKHSIRYNFIMNFILTVSQIIFPLITFPYVSRVLLASGNGKISFAASIANYFMMAASLGIPTYGVRACAQVRDDKPALSKTVQEIFFINFLMTVLVTITYIICIFTVPRFYADKTLFMINGINIVLNLFGMNWFFQALEQYDYITIRSLVFKIISIILMFVLIHEPNDYVLYGAITVFAAAGANLLNFMRICRLIKFKWMGHYNIKIHLKPIMVLFAQSLAVSIYTNLDTVMLGFLKTDLDVGYYNAAIKIKLVLIGLVTSLGNVLLPRMSYYVKAQKNVEFRETTLKALNFTTLMSIPLVVYFAIFSKESIDFLAGEGYLGAVLAMQIITISIIPIGITGVLGIQVLTALGKERYVLYSVIVGASIDFLLNMICIPNAGAAGAAFATVIAEFAVLFIQLIYTRSLIIEIGRRLRFHVYLVIAAAAGMASGCIKTLDLSSSFIILLISSIVFFGLYGLGLFFTKEPMVQELIAVATRRGKKKKGDM